jgi:MoxR-like ATPase
MRDEDKIYKGNKKLDEVKIPKYRDKESDIAYRATDEIIDAVNTSIYLRRPLLVKGKPGLGKSSLAKSIAKDLGIELIHWRITSKSTLESGLYSYDAIARLHDASRKTGPSTTAEKDISKYLSLGPLGTAFAYLSKDHDEDKRKKCVLLIDEIDKSDIDLPNDLLHILEELEFEIEELKRMGGTHHINYYKSDKGIDITNGKITATDIPIIIMTSNDTREFPSAFLRRCIQTKITMPDKKELIQIVQDHFGELEQLDKDLVDDFYSRVDLENPNRVHLSIDQLLNAIYLLRGKLFDSENIDDIKKEDILKLILKDLEQ